MEFQQKIQMEFEQIPPNYLLVTMVTEVKSHYFRGRGSTTSVAVKKFFFHFWRNLAILSFLSYTWLFTATTVVLPRPRKCCNFTSITVAVPRLYQQMIWRNIYKYILPSAGLKRKPLWQKRKKNLVQLPLKPICTAELPKPKVRFSDTRSFTTACTHSMQLSDLQM